MIPVQITRIEIMLHDMEPVVVTRSNVVAHHSGLHDYQPRLRTVIGRLLMDTRPYTDEELTALNAITYRGETV